MISLCVASITVKVSLCSRSPRFFQSKKVLLLAELAIGKLLARSYTRKVYLHYLSNIYRIFIIEYFDEELIHHICKKQRDNTNDHDKLQASINLPLHKKG